jgi:hypothetical protein
MEARAVVDVRRQGDQASDRHPKRGMAMKHYGFTGGFKLDKRPLSMP